jgi:hypothetical protein
MMTIQSQVDTGILSFVVCRPYGEPPHRCNESDETRRRDEPPRLEGNGRARVQSDRAARAVPTPRGTLVVAIALGGGRTPADARPL